MEKNNRLPRLHGIEFESALHFSSEPGSALLSHRVDCDCARLDASWLDKYRVMS